MKKTLLILAVILIAACATSGEPERTADIWESGETLPTYRVKEMPNGEVRVYEYGNPYEYKYRVTPDGKVYQRGNPFQRVGEIKPADKKGK